MPGVAGRLQRLESAVGSPDAPFASVAHTSGVSWADGSMAGWLRVDEYSLRRGVSLWERVSMRDYPSRLTSWRHAR